ncbi:MAG: acetate--CoA ligase family protein [Thermoleophilia bacterium]
MQDPAARARTPDLRPLFAPRSVVVVGASANAQRVAGRPLSFLRAWEFPGELAAVNPNRDEVQGVPSYASVGDVPFTPETAIVCLPAARVLGALEECAAVGVRAAIVFAAGFGEVAGGCPDEPAIRTLCEQTGLVVCGPNGLGTIGVADRFPGTFSGVLAATELLPGDVAFATQSGALGIYLFAEAARRGLGFSRWISTGNEAALTFEQVLAWLAQDDATRVICGYVEGIRDGDAFREALRAARAAGKQVVLLKGGASEAGARGASSHTGAIAGDHEVFRGVLAQEGAIEVDDPVELLDAAMLLRLRPRLAADRGVAVATTSGGGAIVLADWLARHGIRLASLAPATTERVAAAIPEFGSAGNPVDFTGNLMNEMGMVDATIGALVADPDVTATIVFVGVAGAMGESFIDHLLATDRPADALVCCVWIGIPDPLRRRLVEGGVPVFTDVGSCVRALAHVLPPAPPAPRRAHAAAAARDLLPESEAKALLAAHGLPVPRSTLVPEGEAAGALVGRFAVKGQAVGVAHKTELGLVRLGVEGAAVPDAVEAVREAAARAGAQLDGVLVEELAPPGVELLVTLRRDPTFGWVVVVGAGGTFTEALRDVAARACPVSAADVRAALDGLRVGALLRGWRGAPLALEDAYETVARLSALAADLPGDLEELELNPVIVGPEGAMIVDAVGFRGERAAS